jgi:hypothetical protein
MSGEGGGELYIAVRLPQLDMNEASNRRSLRVCPETSGRIAEFSEHEAD